MWGGGGVLRKFVLTDAPKQSFWKMRERRVLVPDGGWPGTTVELRRELLSHGNRPEGEEHAPVDNKKKGKTGPLRREKGPKRALGEKVQNPKPCPL